MIFECIPVSLFPQFPSHLFLASPDPFLLLWRQPLVQWPPSLAVARWAKTKVLPRTLKPTCNPKQPFINYKWLFQLDDSQSLHRKWLFHQTSIYKWLFGVPGKNQALGCPGVLPGARRKKNLCIKKRTPNSYNLQVTDLHGCSRVS